jgi:hypothetical protein
MANSTFRTLQADFLKGVSGVKNYIPNSSIENNSTNDWSLGTTGTLTNGIPTGTPTFGSGASGNLSIAVATSNVPRGLRALSLVSSAATTAGNMLATSAIALDTADQAKVLTFKFCYNVPSNPTNGNFSGTSSNSFGVACYDVTNSSWLPVAGNFSMTQNSGVGIATGTMQTNATTASVRFVIYNANATSGAITVNLDDLYLGPQVSPIGPVVTDPVSWTPTGSWVTNTTYTGKYQRVGNMGLFEVLVSLTGAPTNAALTINLPFTIDTAAFPSSTTQEVLGVGQAVNGGSGYEFAVLYSTTTAVRVLYKNAAGTPLAYSALSATAPVTWANTDVIAVRFTAPIVGWSSNTQMSNDTDTRVVAARATRATAQAIATTSPVKVDLTAVSFDTHGGFDITTNDRYTAPVTGIYQVIGAVYATGVTAGAPLTTWLYKNGSQNSFNFASANTPTEAACSVIDLIQLNAGDYIELWVSSTDSSYSVGNSAAGTFLSLERLSGPAVVAATESVNARYNFVGSTGLTTTTFTTLSTTYATYTKIRDSHNAFSTTGVYTVPVSGMYRVSLRTTVINTAATTGVVASKIIQGGSASTTSTANTPFGAISTGSSAQVTDTFYCQAGDTITIQGFQSNAASIALYSVAEYNSFSIERVGN